MAAGVGDAAGVSVGVGTRVKVGGKVGVAAAVGAVVAVGVGGGIVGAAVGGGGTAQAKTASNAAIPIRVMVKDFRKDRAGGIRLLPKGIWRRAGDGWPAIATIIIGAGYSTRP